MSRVMDDFLELTKLDALSYNERAVADRVIELLSELGIETIEDDAGSIIGGNTGNLLGVFEGNSEKPPILLSAHLDTVAPGTGKRPVSIIKGSAIRNDENANMYFKTGLVIESDSDTVLGADDIAGVVEILDGIRRVKESGADHRTVEILFTVAEEVYTKGAANFDYEKIKSKEGYCFDLSGDVGIAAAKAPTLISFKIIITGKASHAGFAPQEGINAIQAAADAISKIKQGQVDEQSTVNIGTISGGTATNIVSESCTVCGEIRSYSHSKAEDYLESIRSEFEKSAEKFGAITDFTHETHFRAYEVDEKEEVVQRFNECCDRIGLKPVITKTLGGADNHQFNAHGIKGLVVSCGMENVHTTNEYILVGNLENGARLVEELITC